MKSQPTKNKGSVKLKTWREGRGMSQEALAREFGVTKQAVSSWELGTSIPKLTIVKDLFDKANIQLQDWLS